MSPFPIMIIIIPQVPHDILVVFLIKKKRIFFDTHATTLFSTTPLVYFIAYMVNDILKLTKYFFNIYFSDL